MSVRTSVPEAIHTCPADRQVGPVGAFGDNMKSSVSEVNFKWLDEAMQASGLNDSLLGLNSLIPIVGGITPCSMASTAFIIPAIPLDGSLCPRFVLIETSRSARVCGQLKTDLRSQAVEAVMTNGCLQKFSQWHLPQADLQLQSRFHGTQNTYTIV